MGENTGEAELNYFKESEWDWPLLQGWTRYKTNIIKITQNFSKPAALWKSKALKLTHGMVWVQVTGVWWGMETNLPML